MKITKAVITAAGPRQRRLPLQMVVDRDGAEKSVLGIQIAEAVRAQVEEICVVVFPGDEAVYAQVAGEQPVNQFAMVRAVQKSVREPAREALDQFQFLPAGRLERRPGEGGIDLGGGALPSR